MISLNSKHWLHEASTTPAVCDTSRITPPQQLLTKKTDEWELPQYFFILCMTVTLYSIAQCLMRKEFSHGCDGIDRETCAVS